MVQRFLALAAVLGCLCFSAVVAEAKVPIPCTSEKIVNVAQLPRIEAFALPGSQFVDLAYLYQGCFSGKWVGSFGASDRYITWKEGRLSEIVAASGMTTLPEPPGFLMGLTRAPGQFWVEWLYLVLVVGGAVATLFKALGEAKAQTALPNTDRPGTDATVPGAAVKSGIEAALQAAVDARAKGRVMAQPEASSAIARPVRRPDRVASAATTRQIAKATAPVFGRRA